MTHIAIDTSKKEAKLFLEFIKSLSFVKIYEKPNATTLKAMGDAKKGKKRKHSNTKELISFLNK